MAPDDSGQPDEAPERENLESVQDAAKHRQHERATSIEDTFEAVRADLGNHAFPVTSEDLSAYYADQPIDLPNETESLASAFGRLDMEFDDPDEAYEALVSEFDEGRLEGLDDEAGAENPQWDEARATGRQDADSDGLEREDESELER